MMEQEFKMGKCPKCGHDLKVPTDLKVFSCMYCGSRLGIEELLTEEKLRAREELGDLQEVLPRLVTCVTNYRGYQNNITRDRYVGSFELYTEGCGEIIRELDCCLTPDDEAGMRLAAERMLDDLEADWEAGGKKNLKQRIDFDKIVIAIFFVPMVQKLALPISVPFCNILQKTWVERHPKSPFYVGDYDSIASGFRKKLFGLCFITTAVCEAEGKPDDCAELTAFRAFRDGWLKDQPDGEALIDEYYNIAPGIVTCINLGSDREAKYAEIRDTYLRPCYDDLQQGRFDACKARYVKMVRTLEKEYLS